MTWRRPMACPFARRATGIGRGARFMARKPPRCASSLMGAGTASDVINMATRRTCTRPCMGCPLGRRCGLSVVIAISPKNQPPQSFAEGCRHGRGSAGRRHAEPNTQAGRSWAFPKHWAGMTRRSGRGQRWRQMRRTRCSYWKAPPPRNS